MSFVVLFLVSLLNSRAYAQYPQPFAYQYKALVEPQLISTSANLNNEGNSQPLADSGRFLAFSNKISLAYHPKEKFQLFGGTTFAHSQSKTSNIDRSNTNFTDVFAGLYYFYRTKNLELIPVSHLSISVAKPDFGTDEVFMSEQAHALNLGSWMIFHIQEFKPYFFLGATLMSDDRAQTYQAIVGARYAFTTWSLFTEVFHSAPFKGDTYEKQPQVRTDISNRVNAGSLKFFSINPVSTDLAIGFDTEMTELSKSGMRLSYPISGERIALGLTISAFFSWEFGADPEVRELLDKPVKDLAPKPGKKKKFKEQIEEDDQNFFKEK